MRPHEVLTCLFDVAGACDLLELFTAGRTFEDYEADPMLRSAVERQFEVAGEALKRAIDLDPTLADRIKHSARIVAFRNRLIHGYATLSNEVVWGVVEGNLPTLHREVKALLEESRAPEH